MVALARTWWFAAVPAVLGLLLAVWGIGASGPWLDEVVTIHALTQGFGVHVGEAPLLPYYAVAWLWSGAGAFTSIEWLRLLSALSIAAGSIAVALAGRRLAGTRVGFVAAMFFVIAPGVSRYAQEARVYALATALMAVATWALVHVLTDGSRRWWIVFGVGLGTAGLLLPTAWAVVPAYLVVVLGHPGVRRHLADGLTTLLLLTPIVVVQAYLGMHFSALHTWLAAPGLTDLPLGLLMPVHSEYTSAAVPALLVMLCLFSAAGRRWLLGIAASVALVWVVSLLLGSWWTARSFLPLASLLCIAAALALARSTWWLVGIVLGLVAVLALPQHIAIRQAGDRGPDVREIVRIIDEQGQAGDRRLVATSDLMDWTVAAYFGGDPRGFTRTLEPVAGRYWELAAEPTCAAFEEWAITGGGTLRLCR